VIPAGAEIDPITREVWYGSSDDPSGMTGGWSSFASSYRYSEERIHAQETLYALGWFQTLDGGADLSSEIRQRLAALKKDPVAMKRFDRDGDGQIDVEEWDAAREVVSGDVAREFATRPVSASVHTLSVPPSGEHPFLISGRSQEELARRYGWRAAGGLVGFLGAAAAAVVYFFQR
jgi:hypothetical protein